MRARDTRRGILERIVPVSLQRFSPGNTERERGRNSTQFCCEAEKSLGKSRRFSVESRDKSGAPRVRGRVNLCRYKSTWREERRPLSLSLSPLSRLCYCSRVDGISRILRETTTTRRRRSGRKSESMEVGKATRAGIPR